VKVRARNSVHDAPIGARLVAVDKANDLALMRVANGAVPGGVPVQNVNVAMHTTQVRSFSKGSASSSSRRRAPRGRWTSPSALAASPCSSSA